jgi:D-ribose pyranase
MLRAGILNTRLLATLAAAGHGDLIIVADAGLPTPAGVEVIDLSLVDGVPGFAQVSRVVLEHLAVESCILATESAGSSAVGELDADLDSLPRRTIDHAEFKRLSTTARAIIRTGECTPFANIAFVAGTTF